MNSRAAWRQPNLQLTFNFGPAWREQFWQPGSPTRPVLAWRGESLAESHIIQSGATGGGADPK